MGGKRDTYGHEIFSLEHPTGKRLDIISINWCDKTTWYPGSTQVDNETLTDSGDGLSFNPAVQRHWIDVTHGKLTGEDFIKDTYAPVIKVDGALQTENSPGQTDNDYSINYDTGVVTFNNSQSGSTVLAERYHYAGSSSFSIAPDPGKLIRLVDVEVQFSNNVDLTDTVYFQMYVGGSPYLNPVVYKTMYDYINEAAGSFPQIAQMGGNSWRGMKGPLHIYRWPYAKRGTTDLYSSMGLEIRVYLENDIPFGGDFAVATFYGKSIDEE